MYLTARDVKKLLKTQNSECERNQAGKGQGKNPLFGRDAPSALLNRGREPKQRAGNNTFGVWPTP